MYCRITLLSLALFFSLQTISSAWTPLDVDQDPLVRMPGTQPSPTTVLASPSHEVAGGNVPNSACVNCHKGDPVAQSDQGMPFVQWQGSMMAQAARDPIFWATLTVAAQDSIWATGRPNATDICLRCHFPEGWMGDRSSQPNGSAMTGSDFDGVHCAVCHRMYDPFYETTSAGTREGGVNQQAYWDEATTLSSTQADLTKTADAGLASLLEYFNGDPLFTADEPTAATYIENAGGQMFMDTTPQQWRNMRGPFADPELNAHQPANTILYSRYHKSKYFCSTCHDVSNPVLENIGADDNQPLPSETQPAYAFQHVERTFSEFMSSIYSQDNGFPTNQEFQDQGGTGITIAAKCQDCHMADVDGVAAASGGGVIRPDNSTEHVFSGVPAHDLQGGNIWITRILASLDESLGGMGIYDTTNVSILNQGAATLTLDLTQGINPMDDSNGEALLAASERAKSQLLRAATIKNVSYDSANGILNFRVQNNTGHKLLTGYPEGRRMYLNIKAYSDQDIIYEINPYDSLAGTFKGGLSFWNYNGDDGLGDTVVPAPAALTSNEAHDDSLIYEAVTRSALTGEDHTFHFALSTGRYKDNRIPPKFFNLAEAIKRLCEPVAPGGISDQLVDPGETNLYTPAEYAGGFDSVTVTIPDAATKNITHVEINLFYQGTSREYIEFLRDEINGTGGNLALYGPDNVIGANNTTYYDQNAAVFNSTPNGDNAYLVQSATPPSSTFFSGLKAWGNSIWKLWYHNHGLDGSGASVEGIVPFSMYSTQIAAESTAIYTIEISGDGTGQIQDTLTSDVICDKPTSAPVTCNVPYVQGSQIDYTAVPQAGSSFAGFSGSATIDGTNLKDTVNQNETIKAAFMVTVPNTVLYTIELKGDGLGHIEETGTAKVLCQKSSVDSASCSLPYTIGTELSFKAVKGEESVFKGFQGDAQFHDDVMTDTVTAEERVTATFKANPNMSMAIKAAISIAAEQGKKENK